MTVIADNKHRVTLPTKPGERFDIQVFGTEKFVLTRLVPADPQPSRVTIKKVDGFAVGVLGHSVNETALKEALAEWP
jgi:hypothetical protein